MKISRQCLNLFFTGLFLLVPCVSWAGSVRIAHTEVELLSSVATVRPGDEISVALKLKPDPGWYVYAHDPGEVGLAPVVRWQLPPNAVVGDLVWPKSKKIVSNAITANIYEGEALIFTTIRVPESAVIGENFKFSVNVTWVACQIQCVPGKALLNLSVPVSQETRLKTGGIGTSPFKSMSLAGALLFAFIGGIILNLMPCVLPVLSLKIFSFMKEASENPRRLFLHGLIFTAGVVSSFWILAGLMIFLQAAGSKLGWGFQLQSPAFIIALSFIFFIFALNLFCVFEMGVTLTGAGQSLTQGRGLAGSFFSGVFATVVATPCTAPFMGAALGFTLSQPPVVSLGIFTALGLGMSSPYLLLCSQPSLIRCIPKPGRWMDRLKKILGLPLVATVFWLSWVLALQKGQSSVILLWTGLLIAGSGVWVYGRWAGWTATSRSRRIATATAVLLILLGFTLALHKIADTDRIPVHEKFSASGVRIVWETYSDRRLKDLRASGKPVFIDFTAAWCLTCQVNERLALNHPKVIRAFSKKGVATLKADWTSQNAEIASALDRYGRNSVPLYVLYGSNNSEPVILPEILTPSIVLESLEKVADQQTHEAPSRAMFVSVIQNPIVLSSKQAMTKLIEFSKKSSVKTLFVQVYRENKSWFPSAVGDPSPYETCFKNVGEDPFARLIRQAHAEGIQVHAWLNLMSLGSNENAPLIKKYGVSILTKNLEEKIALSDYKIDGQFFLEPGDPRVRQEMTALAEEVVTRYPGLDGIQLDYIRYPDWKPHYGYGEKNVQRFKKAHDVEKINEESSVWQNWKRDQVTALLRELKEAVLKIHPGLQVSTTGLVSYTRANMEAFQDWRYWVQEGIVDFVTLMNYTHEDTARFERCIRDARHQIGDLKKVNVAVGSYKLIDQPQVFADQWQICEDSGAKGCVVFHYGDLLENPALAETLLEQNP